MYDTHIEHNHKMEFHRGDVNLSPPAGILIRLFSYSLHKNLYILWTSYWFSFSVLVNYDEDLGIMQRTILTKWGFIFIAVVTITSFIPQDMLRSPQKQTKNVSDNPTNASLGKNTWLSNYADVIFSCGVLGERSGTSVAIVGDVNGDGHADLLIGAPYRTSYPTSGGVACLLYGRDSFDHNSWYDLANATFYTSMSGAQLGSCVAAAGDVNNDGYQDFLIGAGGMGQRVYLFYGGPTPYSGNYLVSTDADATFIGTPRGAGAGDINNDGYDDLLINDYADSNAGMTGNGMTFLFYGNSSFYGDIDLYYLGADAYFYGEGSNEKSGWWTAGAGDVNNDNYDDILIGAPGYPSGANIGKVYLVYGNGSLNKNMSLTSANASFIGEGSPDNAGYSVDGAGDVNNDGYADILIGAPNTNFGTGGKAYLVFGNGSLNKDMNLNQANASFLAESSGDRVGDAVAGVGDLNNDNYDDFLIGASNKVITIGSQGKTYFVYGSPLWQPNTGLNLVNASFIGAQSSHYCGISVAGDGDVNGDGNLDFLIGNPGTSSDYGGYTYLLYGPDAIKPAQVVDLATSNPTENGFTLTWTAPGDDGMNGTVSGYLLKYSQNPITTENFNFASTYTTTGWSPYAANGTGESRTITGLNSNTLYYFAIKALDEEQNAGPMSNVPSGTTLTDVTAPAQITDLKAINPSVNGFTLTWTAPGDNGISGSVAGYILRYSTSGPITNDAEFDTANNYTHSWSGFVAGGGQESRVVNSLAESTLYWFALKAYDEVPNNSSISNCAYNTTLDGTAPGSISDLYVYTPSVSGFILNWTAPGDDGAIGTVTGYYLRYSLSPINSGNFDAATNYTHTWTGFKSAGEMETRTITGLAEDTTYYFALKAFDDRPQNGSISNCAYNLTLDNTAPATITDLGVSNPTDSGFTLTWTAPGDNGGSGTVTGYIVRYSLAPITNNDEFDGATDYSHTWTSFVTAGQLESRIITGLAPITTYYFALKAFDEIPNQGAISNGASGTTIDNVLPSITHPSDLTFTAGAVGTYIFEWNVADTTINSPTYNITVNGVANVTGVSWTSGTSIELDVSGWAAGTYTVVITASDGYGHSIQDEVRVVVNPSTTNLPGGGEWVWVVAGITGAGGVTFGMMLKKRRKRARI